MGREILTWALVVVLLLLLVVTLPGAVLPGVALAAFGRWLARVRRPRATAA